MSKDSVKFLNEKCFFRASITARQEIVENEEYSGEYDKHLHLQLGRMLGARIMEDKAETALDRDPGTGDYVRHAEIYVLSVTDMHKLYSMIRDEIRREFS